MIVYLANKTQFWADKPNVIELSPVTHLKS